jgi:hypothetical protein
MSMVTTALSGMGAAGMLAAWLSGKLEVRPEAFSLPRELQIESAFSDVSNYQTNSPCLLLERVHENAAPPFYAKLVPAQWPLDLDQV